MKIRLSCMMLAAVLLCVPLSSGAQQKKAGKPGSKVELSRDSVLIGDQIVLSARFSVPSDAPLQIFPYTQTLSADTTLHGGVEVVREFMLDTLSMKNGISELRAKVLLTSFDSGSYRLPHPVVVTVGKDGLADTVDMEDPLLYVNTIQIDTTSFKPFDIKGQEKYPVKFRDFLTWILIALAVVAVLLALLRYIRMRREQKDFFGNSLIKEPPHIVALRKLEKLRGEKLWQSGKEKAYYTGITDTLREYIEKRYGFGAMEKTSTEIIEALGEKNIDARIFVSLSEMFRTADLVKFAKYIPAGDENENAIPVAVNFVNFAYMQQIENDPAQGERPPENGAAHDSGNIKKREGK